MTNLDKLADDLIALINSKPRSPTREEIVALLVAQYQPSAPSKSTDGERTLYYMGLDFGVRDQTVRVTVNSDGSTIASIAGDPERPQDYLVSQAQLENAVSCKNGHDFAGPWQSGELKCCHRCGHRATGCKHHADGQHRFVDLRPDIASSEDVNVFVVPQKCACGERTTRPG